MYRQLITTSLMIFAMTAATLPAYSGDATKNKKELTVKVTQTPSTVTVTAKGKSGYHINTLYPWKLIVEGPKGEKKIYKKQDAKQFSEKTVVFEVPHVKGQTAKLKMSVCNDTQCIMHTESLSW